MLGFFAVLFAVYGSLVPLNFHYRPWDDVWRQFVDQWQSYRPSVTSRTDWAVNILLFVPPAFLFLGVLWFRRFRFFSAVLLLPSLLMLSLVIEGSQLYFPGRSSSFNDVLAQQIGTILGIVLWWWRGEAVCLWWRRWRQVRGAASLAEQFLWLYLLILFGYHLMPLDLTISPVEIYHKWTAGRIRLWSGFSGQDAAQIVYQLATDILLWAPVSLLWIVSKRRTPLQAWCWTVLAATALEIGQLLVFSRVTDMMDIVLAMVGGGLGVAIGQAIRGRQSVESSSVGSLSGWSAGLLLWCVLLVVIFWYPFDFQLSGAELRRRWQGFWTVPFTVFFHDTELRAVTSLLQKTLFFMPVGIISAFLYRGWCRRQWWAWAKLWHGLALSGGFLLGLAIEWGQLLLPGKSADITDAVLMGAGAGMAYIMTCRLLARMLESDEKEHRDLSAGAVRLPLAAAGDAWAPVLASLLLAVWWCWQQYHYALFPVTAQWSAAWLALVLSAGLVSLWQWVWPGALAAMGCLLIGWGMVGPVTGDSVVLRGTFWFTGGLFAVIVTVLCRIHRPDYWNGGFLSGWLLNSVPRVFALAWPFLAILLVLAVAMVQQRPFPAMIKGIPGWSYDFYKDGFLWVAVGLLAHLAGGGRAVRLLLWALPMMFAVMMTPLLMTLHLSALQSLLAAWIGTLVGCGFGRLLAASPVDQSVPKPASRAFFRAAKPDELDWYKQAGRAARR